MFFKIGAVIDDNTWDLAAPGQDEGQDQSDAMALKPAGVLIHDSPLVISGDSVE
jgi:hypothetical protein